MSGGTFSCAIPFGRGKRIVLGHGSGGTLSNDLIRQVFLPAFENPVLARLEDQAVVRVNGTAMALTTDSFVVKPLFFPGGDIGSLAVYGTVNDLAMGGAKPLCISVAFILEEGLDIDVLKRVVASMSVAAARCCVPIVTGDTKVVENGKGDGLYVNTSGVGIVDSGVVLCSDSARPGDRVILSGSIGEHGIAILAQREGLELEGDLKSDAAPLHELVLSMIDTAGHAIRCMRDPTRGGVSSALNEIAAQSRVRIALEERNIPVRDEVRGACELLGLDPLYVANEGKLLAIVAPDAAPRMVAAMRDHPLGAEACIVGTVMEGEAGLVTIHTAFGTTRIVDMLPGDQLPRIC